MVSKPSNNKYCTDKLTFPNDDDDLTEKMGTVITNWTTSYLVELFRQLNAQMMDISHFHHGLVLVT